MPPPPVKLIVAIASRALFDFEEENRPSPAGRPAVAPASRSVRFRLEIGSWAGCSLGMPAATLMS